MFDKVEFLYINDFVKSVEVGIRQHVEHAHIVLANKIFRNDVQGVSRVNARSCRGVLVAASRRG